MKSKLFGNRYPLLLYRRTLDRVWRNTFLLGLILLAIWALPLIRETSLAGISSKDLILAAAAVVMVLAIFALLGRRVAYAQVYNDHLRLVTPFLRLNISFRRIRSTYPVMLQQLYPASSASWAQRRFLEPFFGKTVIVIELKGYPVSPNLLRFFLPAQMFSPRSEGLVVLTDDWMKFSAELDTMRGNWLHEQKNRTIPASGYGRG
jgi:hypothetical protein